MCNQEEDIKVSHNIKKLEFCEAHNQWNKLNNKVAYYDKGCRVIIDFNKVFDCLNRVYSM